MVDQDPGFFNPHFHIEETEGVLVLLLGNSAPIDEPIMKDILRAVHRMDPVGGLPILVQQDELVRMTPEAKTFLARTCDNSTRPVASMAYDLPDRTVHRHPLRGLLRPGPLTGRRLNSRC